MSFLYNRMSTGLFGDPNLAALALADAGGADRALDGGTLDRPPEIQTAGLESARVWDVLQRLLEQQNRSQIGSPGTPRQGAPSYVRSDPRSVLVDPRFLGNDPERERWRRDGAVLGTAAGGSLGLLQRNPLWVLLGAIGGNSVGGSAGGQLYDQDNGSRIRSGGMSTPQGWTFGVGGP